RGHLPLSPVRWGSHIVIPLFRLEVAGAGFEIQQITFFKKIVWFVKMYSSLLSSSMTMSYSVLLCGTNSNGLWKISEAKTVAYWPSGL
ncbi:MAG TPA: hypothetical protein VII92_11910, partial [Anaerolineae bacterium]